MINLNPLDILKRRELKILPPHFGKISIEFYEEKIHQWIKYKLKGRFCIVRMPFIDRDNKLKSSTFVGFEDQKELTYFMLACPYLRRN
jgi:hypothetical protein